VKAIEERISLNRAVSALLDYSLASRLDDRLIVHGRNRRCHPFHRRPGGGGTPIRQTMTLCGMSGMLEVAADGVLLPCKFANLH
jgi:hypothetical protein